MKPRARHPQLPDAEYERLLAAQGGHCALCPNTPKTRRLHTDTDHTTKAVRGLLCYRCNRYLHGWMSSAWLRRAAAYIEFSTDGENAVGYLLGRVAQVYDGRPQAHRWSLLDARMVERLLGRR